MRDPTSDIMRQGFTKRLPAQKGTAVGRRIKTLRAALAGKSGFQSEWAMENMRHELHALLRPA